jgi:DNA-binding NarL/FixJ family response regulator
MLPPEEHQRRLELYNQGLTDAAIAEKLFISSTVIFRWRKNNGLAANAKK